MQDESKIRQMNCTEFEALLTDALDGTLQPTAEQRFQAHLESCSLCQPLFEETKAGLGWLRSLEAVEPPANLVHNILVQTTMQESGVVPAAVVAGQGGWRERAAERLARVLDAVWGTVRQPRFGMSFAMAFFSVSLLLNVAGVRITDVGSLRPGAIASNARMTYYQTTGRAIKYFQDLRFVYELESKVQELRRATGIDEEQQQQQQQQKQQKDQQQKQQKKDDNGLTEQERKQNQNYSKEMNGMLMAECIPPSDINTIPWARRDEAGHETRSVA